MAGFARPLGPEKGERQEHRGTPHPPPGPAERQHQGGAGSPPLLTGRLQLLTIRSLPHTPSLPPSVANKGNVLQNDEISRRRKSSAGEMLQKALHGWWPQSSAYLQKSRTRR